MPITHTFNIRDILTIREIEVLRHACHGATMKGTAQSMKIRPDTVRNHRTAILLKLGLLNITHACFEAGREGLFN